MKRRDFHAALRKLRKELPCTHPVRVRVVETIRDRKCNESWGDCGFYGDRFRIRIRAGYEPFMVWILCHEYAHVMCWWSDRDEEYHGPEWGVAYSRCYRVIS